MPGATVQDRARIQQHGLPHQFEHLQRYRFAQCYRYDSFLRTLNRAGSPSFHRVKFGRLYDRAFTKSLVQFHLLLDRRGRNLMALGTQFCC
jgi:hypothetical protein